MRLLAMAGALGALAGVANAQTLYKQAHTKPDNRPTYSSSGATKAPSATRAKGEADGMAAWKASHALPHPNVAPRGVPPANDNCANAQVIFDGRTPYDATGATTDGTNSCGFNNGNDVWFLYTATADGPLSIDVCDDSRTYDTVMSVYTGGCGGTEIACNDDGGPAACYNPGGGGGFGGSNVTIPATAGTQYLIEVSCYNSDPAGIDAITVAAVQPCVLTPPAPAPPRARIAAATPTAGATALPTRSSTFRAIRPSTAPASPRAALVTPTGTASRLRPAATSPSPPALTSAPCTSSSRSSGPIRAARSTC